MSLSIKSAALALATACFAIGGLASATEPTPIVELPAQLINMPDVEDATGPCSLCLVDKVKVTDPEKQEAALEIFYNDDDGAFIGDIEMTVLLYSGQYHTVRVEGVQLQLGELAMVDLPAEVEWVWADDVRHTWVELERI